MSSALRGVKTFTVPPLDDLCDARHDDLTSITCERPKGHSGEHEGFATVTWPRDEDDQ